MTLTQWMVGFLLMGFYQSHGLSHFPEHFVVAKRNDMNPTVLTCHTGPVTGAITWRHDGGKIEGNEYGFQQNGHILTVSDVETPNLGRYSCWKKDAAGEKELSSTYLLLEADGEEESDSALTCWATSYNCNFSCKWTDSEFTAVRLGVGPECAKGEKSCLWVNRNHPTSDGEFQFVLHHSLSPFEEETNRLEITAEAIQEMLLLRLTKRFYLRDIVRPDSPTIVSCKRQKQELNVTIEPPATWSTPHSFFRLEHQIEYILLDDGTTGRSSSHMIPQGVDQLRVRCRDSLVMSKWSQWSQWKNVTSCKK